jgi:hypothetical protein
VKLYFRTLSYITLILFQFSCKSDSNISIYKIKKVNTSSSKINANQNNRYLNWIAPNNWIEKAPKDFRLASFDIPISNGKMIDLSITTFPGDAGGIEQNVNRWRRQLNLDPQNINQILENSQKTSSMLGEYFIFDLNNSDNNNSIVATLIPYSDNNQPVSETIFIKMNGSIMALQELKYEFDLFCKSLHWAQ